jgi:hypothetical protein
MVFHSTPGGIRTHDLTVKDRGWIPDLEQMAYRRLGDQLLVSDLVDDEPDLTGRVVLDHPALPDPSIDVELEYRRTGVSL